MKEKQNTEQCAAARLTEDQIPENLYFLYEIVGAEKFEQILDAAEGEFIYIPKRSTLERDARKKAIRAEYNGRNIKLLAQKYGYSERYIRTIVSEDGKNEDR